MINDKSTKKLILFSSVKNAIYLFAYDILLMIVSFLISIYLFVNYSECSDKIYIIGLYQILLASLLGSSVYYVRKLYKYCINFTSTENNCEDDAFSINKLGGIMYFLLRPLISVFLSYIYFFIIYISFLSIVVNTSNLESTFIGFMIIFGFFTGYCNGNILSGLYKKGESITGIFNGRNENIGV